MQQTLSGYKLAYFAGGQRIDDLNVTVENLYREYKDEDGALYLGISADPPNVGTGTVSLSMFSIIWFANVDSVVAF